MGTKRIEEDNTYVINGPPPLFPLPKVSLGNVLFDMLGHAPNENALVDAFTHKAITYKEIFLKTTALAQTLQQLGYGKNSIFSISSENSLEFFIPVIASFYIGAIMAPVNNNYTILELEHTINLTKPKIIFVSKKVLNTYQQLKKSLKFIDKLILIDCQNNIEDVETLDNFIKNNQVIIRNDFTPTEIDPDQQPAVILMSSGTTGLPKGVITTHTNICVRLWQILNPDYLRVTPTVLGILPFFHGFGFMSTLGFIWLKQTVIFMNRFDENVYLKTIEQFKIATLYVAPPLAIFLAKTPLINKYDLSSIDELLCGAAPLSKNIEQQIRERLNIKSIRQGYGLTEATFATIMVSKGDEGYASNCGSIGRVLSFMKCKVRDPETGKSLGPNQVGEFCFKGPMVMKGYYNNEQATRDTFTEDGWLLSGDIGYYDENKYFYIVDRLKELIKYKAYQVAPAELEGILLTNPKIKDAGVIGVPDELAGELPQAFVVKNPGVQLSEAEVEQYVAERVSPPKKLRGGVIFVSEIPKNPSGKILRRKLREMSKNYKSKL